MQTARLARETDDDLDVLCQVVETTQHPMVVLNVPTRRILAVSPPLAAWFPGLDLIGRAAGKFLVGGPSEASRLLAAGQVDGYELSRELRLPHRTAAFHLWVHVIGDERPAHSAVVVVDAQDTQLPEPIPRMPGTPPLSVIGTVDDEWRIDRLSSDVTMLLGIEPHLLYGASFLTLVHPGDLAELLTGLGHARASGAGVSVRLRLCDEGHRWRLCRATVTPLGERAGFAFLLSPFVLGPAGPDRQHELEQRLARIAHEAHSAGVMRHAHTMPAVADLPDLGKLTSREWQIAMRVRAGERIQQIAGSLHLSPSTVRNHLTAIYRKLGVHSQSELLVLLHRDRIPEQGHPLRAT